MVRIGLLIYVYKNGIWVMTTLIKIKGYASNKLLYFINTEPIM